MKYIKYWLFSLLILNVNTLLANDKVRIASYNILANAHIKPEYYPNASDIILKWDVRKPYLEQYIENIKADIICLQEYENNGLADNLHAKGYKSIIYNEASTHNVGLAIFYHYTKVKLIEKQKFILSNSDKIALMAKFRYKNKEFIVVNTKIKWVPADVQKTKYAGYNQIEWLLLNKLPQSDKSEIVVCGDFNAESDGSIYKLFLRNNFQDIFANNAYNTIKKNDEASRIDYCFSTKTAKFQPTTMKGMNVNDVVPSHTIPSDHLPLIFDFYPE